MTMRNRKIGPLLATALVASNMIGSGIFLLPASLAVVGSVTIIGWLAATLGALCIAAVLGKLGQVAPEPGGPCAYAEDALGHYMGFQANVIYWLCCLIGNIAIAIGAVGYLGHFFPALGAQPNAALASITLVWLFTLANIVGPRFACQLESLTLVIGLLPLALIGTAGWWHFDAQTFRDSWNVTGQPLHTVVPGTLVLVFWAFLGLESASVGMAVVENPRRNVPIATLCGVLLAGIVYMATCSVIMGLLPAAQLAKSTAPFADAAQSMIGPIAGGLVAFAALTKASGTLCGWVLLTAQVSKAAADRGLFPSMLSRTDRHGIPVLNLLLQGVLMTAVVILTISPTLNQQFNKLIEVSVIFCLLTYVYGCTAVWRFGAQQGEESLRRYRPLALVAMLFSLTVIVMSGTQLLALTAMTIFATCLVYPWLMKPGARA